MKLNNFWFISILLLSSSVFAQEERFYSEEVSNFEVTLQNHANDFRTYMFNTSGKDFETALLFYARSIKDYFRVRHIARLLAILDGLKDEGDKILVSFFIYRAFDELFSEKDEEMEAIVTILSGTKNQAIIFAGNDYKKDLRETYQKLKKIDNKLVELYGPHPKFE